jgi:hypothetical protein
VSVITIRRAELTQSETALMRVNDSVIRARTGDCVDTGPAKIASRGGRTFA